MDILSGFKTDHSAIFKNLYSIHEIRGRGFWKFNTSLLQDETYAELVRTCINENKTNFYNALDPNTFWDFLKCQLRSMTIHYSIKKARQGRIQEKNIIDMLNHLESSYAQNQSESVCDEIKA